jgi:hypothetical protein
MLSACTVQAEWPLATVSPYPRCRTVGKVVSVPNWAIMQLSCIGEVHNEELRDLYSSPSIIRIIKSRRMRWVGHVAQMGKRGTRTG